MLRVYAVCGFVSARPVVACGATLARFCVSAKLTAAVRGGGARLDADDPGGFEFFGVSRAGALPSYCPLLVYTLRVREPPPGQTAYDVVEVMRVQLRASAVTAAFAADFLRDTGAAVATVEALRRAGPVQWRTFGDVDALFARETAMHRLARELCAPLHHGRDYIELLRFFAGRFLERLSAGERAQLAATVRAGGDGAWRLALDLGVPAHVAGGTRGSLARYARTGAAGFAYQVRAGDGPLVFSARAPELCAAQLCRVLGAAAQPELVSDALAVYLHLQRRHREYDAILASATALCSDTQLPAERVAAAAAQLRAVGAAVVLHGESLAEVAQAGRHYYVMLRALFEVCRRVAHWWRATAHARLVDCQWRPAADTYYARAVRPLGGTVFLTPSAESRWELQRALGCDGERVWTAHSFRAWRGAQAGDRVVLEWAHRWCAADLAAALERCGGAAAVHIVGDSEVNARDGGLFRQLCEVAPERVTLLRAADEPSSVCDRFDAADACEASQRVRTRGRRRVTTRLPRLGQPAAESEAAAAASDDESGSEAAPAAAAAPRARAPDTLELEHNVRAVVEALSSGHVAQLSVHPMSNEIKMREFRAKLERTLSVGGYTYQYLCAGGGVKRQALEISSDEQQQQQQHYHHYQARLVQPNSRVTSRLRLEPYGVVGTVREGWYRRDQDETRWQLAPADQGYTLDTRDYRLRVQLDSIRCAPLPLGQALITAGAFGADDAGVHVQPHTTGYEVLLDTARCTAVEHVAVDDVNRWPCAAVDYVVCVLSAHCTRRDVLSMVRWARRGVYFVSLPELVPLGAVLRRPVVWAPAVLRGVL